MSADQRESQGRDHRTAQAGPAATPPSLESLDRYPTLDLSALPPAARPAVAAALQAAVGRLAATWAKDGWPSPAAVSDEVLAELVKGQMRQILAGAAKADERRQEGGILAESECPHGVPHRYGCGECDTKNYDDGWG